MNLFREIGTFATVVNRKNKNDNSLAEVYSITKYDGFVKSLEYFKKQVFSRNLSSYKIVKKGEFAYSTIHLDEGSIGLLRNDEALISPMYTVFKTDDSINNRFLELLLTSEELIDRYDLISQGSINRRKSIPFSKLSKLSVRIPPLNEQIKIVRIIDSINLLIQQKKIIVERIKCLRKANIYNFNNKIYKDNFLETSQFPNIPPDWVFKRMNEIGEFKNGLNKSKESFGKGKKFVNISDAYSDELDIDSLERVDVNEKEIKEYCLEYGDLIIVRSSVKLSGVAIPTVFLGSKEPILFSGFMIRFRLNYKNLNPLYLKEYLLTDYSRYMLEKLATKSANININQEALGTFKVLIPPIDKQNFIIEQTLELNNCIKEIGSELHKLNSVKLSLSKGLLNGDINLNSK